jgi:ABC-2 type transport system ATP-binding protein
MIQIDNLTKSYGLDRGVFDLSLEIRQGETFGYLGPNGAGKTTTIRHLMGFLNPDAGRCTIRGLDCRTQAAQIQKFCGYLPGEIAFIEGLTGIDFLKLMAEMRGVRTTTRRDQLLELLELDPGGKIRRMSKGMKQKLGLVAAFLHDPEVLLLDEPTSSLDPLMQKRFVSLVQEEKAAGKTILMSSHSFDEIERTCDRIGIIRFGRLVAVEEISALRSAQRKTYTVTFADPQAAADFVERGFEIISSDDNVVEVAVQANLSEFLAALPEYPVTGLDTVHLRLEEVFMQYYGKDGSHA